MATGTTSCPSGRAITTQADCQAAFDAVKADAGIMNRRPLQVGNWNGVPYGCSIQVGVVGDYYYHDYSAHWNAYSGTDNTRVSNGEFRLICKPDAGTCPLNYPHTSSGAGGRICYNDAGYAAAGTGPCDSWCTLDPALGDFGCGDIELKRCHLAVSCPVMRALIGSGRIQLHDTYSNIMNALHSVLGYEVGTCAQTGSEPIWSGSNWVGKWTNCEFPLKIFEGAMLGPGSPAKDQRDAALGGKVDLSKMQLFFDHGASSGVIGSATNGQRTRTGILGTATTSVDDHHEFNAASYNKLMGFANGDGDASSFTASEWGAAVNHFAGEGLLKHNARVEAGAAAADDVNWLDTPVGRFSWGILGVEYGNTFAVFKDASGKLPYASVEALFKDGRLPNGFTEPLRTINRALLGQTGMAMNIDIPAQVAATMLQNRKDGPAPVVRLICGDGFIECSSSIRDCNAGSECPDWAPYRYPGNNRCFETVWAPHDTNQAFADAGGPKTRSHNCNINPGGDSLWWQNSDAKCHCVDGYTKTGCHATKIHCNAGKTS